MSPSIPQFLAILVLGFILSAAVGRNLCPTPCGKRSCKPGEGCFFIRNVCIPGERCEPFVPVCATVPCHDDETVCTIDCKVGYHCTLLVLDEENCPNRTMTCFPDKGTGCSN